MLKLEMIRGDILKKLIALIIILTSLFGGFYIYQKIQQNTSKKCYNRHQNTIAYKIKEIKKRHSNNLYVCPYAIAQARRQAVPGQSLGADTQRGKILSHRLRRGLQNGPPLPRGQDITRTVHRI